jgi:hypothetical protein
VETSANLVGVATIPQQPDHRRQVLANQAKSLTAAEVIIHTSQAGCHVVQVIDDLAGDRSADGRLDIVRRLSDQPLMRR